MTDIYRPSDRHLSRHSSWKTYQARSKKNRRFTVEGRFGQWLKRIGPLLMLLVAGWLLFFRGGAEMADNQFMGTRPSASPSESVRRIPKSDVRFLIGKTCLTDISPQPLTVMFGDRSYTVKTSLDQGLQHYLMSRLDQINSRYIGIVVMCPKTGKVLAMAGFDKVHTDNNPCLAAEFPAASIFKIITAAAAVEQKGYTHETSFTFTGGKYTLYKRQMTDAPNRYSQTISLQDAFSQSVNPVFGKIGALYLDRGMVEKMGAAFAFNKEVNFELPWSTSHLTLTDDLYHRAEIASGFNRQTLISPLHGAMIAATVVNNGKPVEPTLIDQIMDDAGTCVYQSEPCFLPAAFSPKTARVLEQLMITTVASGTGRKAFLDRNQDKILSQLDIGGKTGSISDREKTTRFDWFTGFAAEKQGNEKIVMAIMVGHEKYIGTRATQYARMVVEHYFREYFSQKTG